MNAHDEIRVDRQRVVDRMKSVKSLIRDALAEGNVIYAISLQKKCGCSARFEAGPGRRVLRGRSPRIDSARGPDQ